MISVLFVRPLIFLFWTSGDVCPGFQTRVDPPWTLREFGAYTGISVR